MITPQATAISNGVARAPSTSNIASLLDPRCAAESRTLCSSIGSFSPRTLSTSISISTSTATSALASASPSPSTSTSTSTSTSSNRSVSSSSTVQSASISPQSRSTTPPATTFSLFASTTTQVERKPAIVSSSTPTSDTSPLLPSFASSGVSSLHVFPSSGGGSQAVRSTPNNSMSAK